MSADPITSCRPELRQRSNRADSGSAWTMDLPGRSAFSLGRENTGRSVDRRTSGGFSSRLDLKANRYGGASIAPLVGAVGVWTVGPTVRTAPGPDPGSSPGGIYFNIELKWRWRTKAEIFQSASQAVVGAPWRAINIRSAVEAALPSLANSAVDRSSEFDHEGHQAHEGHEEEEERRSARELRALCVLRG
jgi:hypothetical protein